MKFLICSLLFILPFSPLFSQSKDLVKLKSEHAKYLSEINRANKLLSSKSLSKRNTLNQLEILISKITTQQDLVSAYKQEIELLNSEVKENKLLLTNLSNDISLLKTNYAILIMEANKMSGSNYNEFMLMFSSESFSEAYRRFQTLRQYSSYRKKQGLLLSETLIRQDSILAKQEAILLSKQETYSKMLAELTAMEKSVDKKKSFVSKLNTDEKWLKNNIRQNLKKSKQLESEIEKLILRESKIATNIPVSDFIKYKGKLSWPVSEGVITSYFGEHNHPSLKGVKVKNNGIDITTSKDSEVKAIFSGTVSRVIAIPGYNKAVIIRHGDYLTVYANLKNVSVKNGEVVVKNHKIGQIFSSNSDNNATLHFEVWEGSKKTNPIIWLSRK